MKNIILISMLIFVGCSHHGHDHGPSQKELVSDYKEHAQQLITLNAKKANSDSLAALAFKLIEKAKPIIKNHKAANPKCGELLDTIISKSEIMTTITLSAIEKDYHDGAALPEAPDNCYEAKELIVHPATVAILTKNGRALSKDNRGQIQDEIEEVIAHIDLLVEGH